MPQNTYKGELRVSGIFGVVTKNNNCMEDLFYGTDYHSHLGTQYAGLAVFGKKLTRQIHGISASQFKSKFFQDYKSFDGNKGIGVISADEEQPLYVNSRFGPFAIVTNGYIDNADELVDKLYSQGESFSEIANGRVNLTELVAKLIVRGRNIVSGIEEVFASISGSCSLLIMNRDGIYAARDRYGYFPLIIGRKKDAVAVTTETSAFPNLGYAIAKYMAPGEILFLNESGLKQQRQGSDDMQICAFYGYIRVFLHRVMKG